MPTAIKQIKDLNNTLHDLDNRYVTITTTSGTLTADQLAILQESNQNYIIYNQSRYRQIGATDTALYYQRTNTENRNQYFIINISTRAWSYTNTRLITENDVSGTSGYLAKFTGAHTVTNGPVLGSDTTKFLRNDGTWSTPDSGTDSKTTQTSISTNNNYPVLLKHSANATEETDAVNATNLTSGTAVSINPSTGNINAVKLNGATIGSSPIFTDTTYTFTGGTNKFTVTPAGGSAQDVTVTPSITNNVTGSGTSGYLTKFNGTNTITNGPALGSDTTKYLRNDGTWVVPPNDEGVTSITINTSAPLSGGSSTAATTTGSWTIAHNTSGVTAGSYGDTSAQTPSFGGTFKVPSFSVDTTGHLSVAGEHTVTIPNETKNTAGSTDTSSKIFLIGATSQAANPQTYSDNEVYATNGQLDAKSFRVATTSVFSYNATTGCLEITT